MINYNDILNDEIIVLKPSNMLWYNNDNHEVEIVYIISSIMVYCVIILLVCNIANNNK